MIATPNKPFREGQEDAIKWFVSYYENGYAHVVRFGTWQMYWAPRGFFKDIVIIHGSKNEHRRTVKIEE